MLTANRPGECWFDPQTVAREWVVSFGKSFRSKRDIVRSQNNTFLCLNSDPSSHSVSIAHATSCSVIFEGVLFNREVARQDTDFILKSYLSQGESFLSGLRGIFSLILWDSANDLLLIARDPLGIQPLFYADCGSDLLISNSINTLLKEKNVSREMNRHSLAEHLCHRWLSLEETYFKKVRRIPQGHTLRIGGNRRRLYRYWDPCPTGLEIDWLQESEVDRFDGLLDQAVHRCLPPGRAAIYLSGGLDSVSVAGVAVDTCRQKSLAEPLALSLFFPDSVSGEETVQKGVAEGLGISQRSTTFREAVGEKGLLRLALETSAGRSAPLLNLWAPAYHYLGLLGKQEGCNVILTGNGGDEWLEVSPFYAADLMRNLQFAGLYHLWNSMTRSYRFSRMEYTRTILWRFGVRQLIGHYAFRFAPKAVSVRRRRSISRSLPAWLAPDPQLRKEIIERMEASHEEPGPDGFYMREVRKALNHPIISLEMEEFFESARAMGMRMLHPYWDADLAEFLTRLPPALLYRGGKTKGLVRKTLARRFPGLGFDQQRKLHATGFFRSVVTTEAPAQLQRLGGIPQQEDLGIIDRRLLERDLPQILHYPEWLNSYRLWYILSVEAWLQAKRNGGGSHEI